MKKGCILLSGLLGLVGYFRSAAQTQIIDMHVHSYEQAHFKTPAQDYYGNGGAADAETHYAETRAAWIKYNVVKAMVSGSPASVDTWKTRDTAGRVIRGIALDYPTDFGMDSVRFEKMVKAGKIQVFGEIGTYYSGTTLSDAIWQPYLRICERYDIPVAVHTGGGDPGGTYTWSPNARLRFGDPYLIEDVLVRYPRLRIYIMHSGEDWYEHALRLMAYYPQLYSDLGAMLWVEPLDQQYATEFLRNAKQAGYIDRVMFGSDQMRWPYAIGKSVEFLNSLDFLTAKDKEDIFYHNAARFLRLEKKDSRPAEAAITGTWRFVADEEVDAAGKVLRRDTNVAGLMIYTTQGKMSVQLHWRGRRAPMMTDTIMNDDGASTGLGLGSNTWSVSQARTIIDTYDAYFGDYTIDWRDHIVTHRITANLRPETAGTVYRRRFRIEGDRLWLRSADSATHWQVALERVRQDGR